MELPELIYLGEEIEAKLANYIENALVIHYAERADMVNELTNYLKDYLAKPATTVNTFPFEGSSNIVVPLAAISAETTFANEMQQLFGLDQFVSVKLPDQFAPLDHEIEKYLDWEFLKGIRIREAVAAPILEKIKFGTGIGRMDYSSSSKRIMVGGKPKNVVTRQGNELKFISLSRFLMPFNSQDPQTAQWCGEEHTSSVAEFKGLINSGLFYDDIEKKMDAKIANPTQNATLLSSDNYRQVVEEKTNTAQTWPSQIGWVQLWMSYDVNDDKEEEEIVVYYNRHQKLILGVRYNWYEDLRRPYRKANHFPVEGRWNGLGVAQQLEQFQREITTVHRQRLDNATVANARVWKVKRSANINPNTPIFPGKFFEVDEIDDIQAMPMGDVYSSAYTNEQQILYYAQQRSGTNELTTGTQQIGTPGTASSDLARLQEAKRRYDYTFRNTKQFVDDLIVDGVCNISQFGHRNIRYFDFVPSGELVKQFFTMPQDLIRQQIIAQIGVIGSQENKLLDRNNWTQLAQIMNQYYTAMLTLSQQLGNPQLSTAISVKAMMGASEAYKQVLESFDVRNLDRITLNSMLNDLFKLPSAGANQNPQGTGSFQQIQQPPIPPESGNVPSPE